MLKMSEKGGIVCVEHPPLLIRPSKGVLSVAAEWKVGPVVPEFSRGRVEVQPYIAEPN
jgi:hypothetical protein